MSPDEEVRGSGRRDTLTWPWGALGKSELSSAMTALEAS